MSLAAKGLLLVLASTVAASPIELYHELLARDPPTALPARATAADLKWQPSLDFDKDGCYNTPAIDAYGNIAQGLDHHNTGGADGCRDLSDLDNNNVYTRQRCNNGWCVYIYDYYFEKDVAVQHVHDVGGHVHDWEHIAVFVQGDEARMVAASKHGKYDTKDAGKIMWDGTHPKIVYHKNGGSAHSFRFAKKKDDNIENHKGVWFRGPLVSWNGFPGNTRDLLVGHDFGKATMAIKDDQFQRNIDLARGKNGAPGFDSGLDVDSPGMP
jgi:hypothetical protein